MTMGLRVLFGGTPCSHNFWLSRVILAAVLLTCAAANHCAAQLCAQLSGVNFTENFNTLATSGSNNTTIPPEFKYVEAGTSGNLTYAADNGSNSSGDTYSY